MLQIDMNLRYYRRRPRHLLQKYNQMQMKYYLVFLHQDHQDRQYWLLHHHRLQ